MKKYIKPSAIILTLILSACSETKTAQQLISSGNSYVQVRDFSSAVIEFKNAVRLEPKNANARFELGNAYLEQGNFVNAEKEFSRAVELGINFSKVVVLLARVKTHLDKTDEVYQLVERSDDLNDDDYVEVLTYAGITALEQNQTSRGQDYLTQAIAINQDALYSRIAQAYIHYADREFAQGLVVISNLLNEQTDATEAMLIQGHLYYALQEFEHASGAFALYLNYHPQDHKVRFFEVNSLIKAEKFEQANVLTDTILLAFKNSPLALQFKAQLEYQKKNYSAARDYAEQALQHSQDFLGAKIIAGLSSYFLGDVEQAYTRLNSIEKSLSSTHPARKILAVTKFKLGYGTAAAEDLSNLESLTSEDVNLLQKSTANLISIGEFDSALAVINKAEQLSPNNAELIAQKGLIQIAQNNINGIQSLEEAIKLDSSLADAQLALAIEYLKAGEDSKAKGIADKLISEHSDKASGYILQGVIYTKEDNVDKAIESFKKSLSISPDNVASLFNLGLLLKEEDSTSSMTYFEHVIKLVATHKGALSNYVALANKTKQLFRSQIFLKNINNNDNLVLTIGLAQSLRLNNQIEEAVALLENFTNKANTDAIYWALLGDLYLQLKNTNKANAAYISGLKLEPKHYFLNLRSISVLELLKKYPEALSRTKFAYTYYPNNDRLEILLAHFEMKNKNINAAKKILNVIQQKQIKHPVVDSVSGQVAMLDNDFEQAINFFSSAFEQKKSEENAIQLARALKFNGQQQEAEKVLEDFVNQSANQIKIRFLLAELYGNESISKKIVQYQAVIDLYPENVLALNNLAWNQYKNGQSALAVVTAEQAYKLAPDNVTILETYGMVLASINKHKNAIKILELAISNGSNDEEVKASLIRAKASIKQ
jgi:putative PEP-CTERM system TPR-repeat lipoprotein